MRPAAHRQECLSYQRRRRVQMGASPCAPVTRRVCRPLERGRGWFLRGTFVAVREAHFPAREGVAEAAAVLGGFAHQRRDGDGTAFGIDGDKVR